MSQRTSLTFWCFILGLVPLHGHSAHLRPIFGRVQTKIIWFLCMTNLKTSGEHLLLRAALWSRSLSGSRWFFTSQIPRMKDHAVVTIVAENCHEIAECSCRQTGIQQKLKSLVQQPLPHGSATLAKHVDMHRASKRGSYLAGFPLAFLSERNFRIASLGQTQLEVSRCHTYLTSQCLSHATHPWKAVKAGHAQHFPSLSSLGSESQIWHLGNPTQTVRCELDWWRPANHSTHWLANQVKHITRKQRLYTSIVQDISGPFGHEWLNDLEALGWLSTRYSLKESLLVLLVSC